MVRTDLNAVDLFEYTIRNLLIPDAMTRHCPFILGTTPEHCYKAVRIVYRWGTRNLRNYTGLV